jgi:2-polyprenyl-3-methyl-5-hydroxy-6-metoxy-1,4-benzoquinol methylase
MKTTYVARDYWQKRLSAHHNLRGVGHLGFGKAYNEWLYRAKARTLEAALSGMDVRGKTVLDVGCGTGFFVDWYTSRGASVSGVDITDRSIESLRTRFPGDFRVQDIGAPDARPPGTFDIVNVWDVLYHVTDADSHRRAVRYIADAVKPDGLLLFTDTLGASHERRAADHVCFRPLATYLALLEPLGFELRGIRFLYRWLNRRVTVRPLDAALGRIYFWLDGRETLIPRDNLSLGIWRRTGEKH